MLRFVFVIFLSWWCIGASGQGVTVPKSTDIVVLRGKSYYLHTVQPGQTLFSICKAYGADLEEVKTLNKKKDNNLSLYEVVQIPYTEPFVQQDSKYYYHKVDKGETLYSISRLYDIKPKRLLKFNAEYSHNEPLSVGAVVKLPLDEINPSVLKQKKELPVSVKQVAVKPEAEKKTEVLTEHVGDVKIGVFPSLKEKLVVKDTLPAKAREVLSQDEKKVMPEYISEVYMPADPFVKVALMLPFSAKDYPRYADSLGGHQSVSLSSRSEQFISFYEGVLLAVDSLKNQGYEIDLHVFDTERNSDKMYSITGDINLLRPDLIIGPVYGSVYKAMADNLVNKDIPMVYPLSSRSEGFEEYANFIQVNASSSVLVSRMEDWLDAQRAKANIVHIALAGADDSDFPEKKILKERMQKMEGVHFFKWDTEQAQLDQLRALLLPDRENILFLPLAKEADVSKILPLLTALADGYRITVVGLPEWQTFTSVDHETYYKLNTKFFTYSYVDYASNAALTMAAKYRKYFYAEPNSLVYKAFDLGLYFIELAAKYRDRSLDAVEYYDQTRGSSIFRFEKIANGVGKENHGFYVVNFGSDYQLKIESLDDLIGAEKRK